MCGLIDFLDLNMHANRKDTHKGKGTTWSLRDPQNSAKMAKIAKMDKNDEK